jgi:hypothetical protein
VPRRQRSGQYRHQVSVIRAGFDPAHAVMEAEDNRDLREALFFGAVNNKHAKNPDHPDEPGSIERVMTHCANEAPLQYIMLLNELIASDDQT